MACGRGLSSGASRAFFSLGGDGDRDGGSQEDTSMCIKAVYHGLRRCFSLHNIMCH